MPVSGTGRSYYIDFMSWIKHRSHYARQTHGTHSAPARSWKCVIWQKKQQITLAGVHCNGSAQCCIVWTVLKQERRYLNKHAVLPKKRHIIKMLRAWIRSRSTLNEQVLHHYPEFHRDYWSGHWLLKTSLEISPVVSNYKWDKGMRADQNTTGHSDGS